MINKYLLLFIISLFYTQCFTQRNNEEKYINDINNNIKKPVSNIIKTNPFVIIWGTIPYSAEYRLNYETSIATRQTMEMGFSYLGKSIILQMIEDTMYQNSSSKPPNLKVRGYRVQGQYRYFIKLFEKYRPEGIYAALHSSYSYAKIFRYKNNDYIKITHINANILFGYQYFVNDNFIIDVFSGIGCKRNKWEEYNANGIYNTIDTDDLGHYYNSNLKIILGCNIGICF